VHAVPEFWRLILPNNEGKNLVSIPQYPAKLWDLPSPIMGYYQGQKLMYHNLMLSAAIFQGVI
jgi:hypothetical protein